VTLPIRPGRPAQVADLVRAQDRERALEQELPAVRAAATAWRNGLGALLAAVVGFGLIKGRSDISKLAIPWNVAAGVLLLLCIVCGAAAALLMLRAAHGVPGLRSLRLTAPGAVWAHTEAVASTRALRCGVRWFFACVLSLVAAVAVTWYGPAADDPRLSVVVKGQSTCGSVVGIAAGILTLKTAVGNVQIDLGQASTIRIVDSCNLDDNAD
jgi:hypothetical protein